MKATKATKKPPAGNLFSSPKKPKKATVNLGPNFGVMTHQLPEHAPRKI